MPTVSLAARSQTITRILCVVVFVTMIVGAIYAAWIGVSNFSRIAV